MIIKLPFLPWDLNIQRCLHEQAEQTTPLAKTTVKRNKYNKVFCIGANKTGTTSLGALLSSFGFKMGDQSVAEILSLDWLANKNTDRIIRYCYTADTFQDVPFSYRGLHQDLDKAFPNSKFILTVRDSPDEWFNSLVSFHTKIFSTDSTRPPNADELDSATYRYKGYALDVFKLAHKYPTVPLYDEDTYKNDYILNNDEKRTYFRGRPNDFIEINLAIKDDFRRLCEFLNVETDITDFPWLNKS